ncbi:DUF262 domain-containing protein [Cohnella xylanilytica]|uniref:DUF262 domain-containing protein n=1 Tax=Cohnella xylanilytica TaxID=557555 RepID=A0A841UC38_9BACL|nr:DUF262 domain-containing protein [Cohnella xylanilytica]MBB6695480.1 DUF262 domain-containing protein [Cohnella xylanilytica]
MPENLTIQGIHVQTLYSQYASKKFIVNRKYQRKLAWTIEEKRNFIDTIIRGLPVPLFLLAEVKNDNEMKLEIIDGMQRLDAIFSFIEQKYMLKDGYFDLSVMADTLEKMKTKTIYQREPVLDSKICKEIANYLLPVSKSLSMVQQEIEETFRRINSSGRHLSYQELRQAGAIGKFPDLVSSLAAEIRGDISRDSVLLNDMSKISITNRRLEYYGINIYEIFWVKNDIMSYRNIRESKDEELIAHIISDMILDNKENYNAEALDSYYGYNSNPLGETPLGKTKIETAIDRISEDAIKKQFDAVFSAIEEILTKKNIKFANLIYRKSDRKENWRSFHVIFMAFYELIVRQSKKVNDEDGLLSSLKGIGDELIDNRVSERLWDWQFNDRTVKSIVGRIQSYFAERVVDDPAFDDWTRNITKILMQSITEQNQYDFKIGVHDFNTGKYNETLVWDIIKTLSAINNLGPNRVGYVLIGLTDDLKSAEKHEAKYQNPFVQIQEFYITGIKDEASLQTGNVDKFLHKIIETIKKAPVKPESYLQSILNNIKSRQYHGKEILILKTEFNEPAWFDGRLYERNGSHSEPVKEENYYKIYNKFQK